MKQQFEAERQAYFLQGAEENLASKDSTCHSALSKHLKNSYFSHLQTTKQWDFIVHDREIDIDILISLPSSTLQQQSFSTNEKTPTIKHIHKVLGQ